MRAGAVDFVVKPAAPQRLKTSLHNAMHMEALQGEIKRIKRSATGKLTVDEIISEVSEAISMLGANGMQDMGKVMGHLSKKLAGKADGKLISVHVRKQLSS